MNESKIHNQNNLTHAKLGIPAPPFEAESNYGTIQLSEYKGKWVVLLSHPIDFCPTWANEIRAFSQSFCELHNLGCQLIGIGGNDVHSPLTWSKAVQAKFQVNFWFPVISDSHHVIARSFSMIDQEDEAAGARRSIYIIDGNQILRSIVYYDSASLDTLNEVIRLVKLLQQSNACGIVTPESWHSKEKWNVATANDKKETEKHEMWYF